MSENKEETQEAAASAAAGAEGHGKIISIDEGRIKEHGSVQNLSHFLLVVGGRLVFVLGFFFGF